MNRIVITLAAFLSLLPSDSGLAAEPDRLLLQFREAKTPSGDEPKAKKFRDSLSALAFAAGGKTLFIGGDEAVEVEPSLEQLTLQNDGSYGAHQSLPISNFINLIDTTLDKDEGRMGEVDVEGLAVSNGYLWFVGSHSTNRKQPKSDKKQKKNLGRLLEVDEGPNRFMLGRIPLKESEGKAELVKESGGRKAGRLKGNDDKWNLVTALTKDAYFGPYFIAPGQGGKTRLPGKDNGFDIEGLAVVGDRIYLGLRGPVLRGWACILELRVKDQGDGGDFELAAFDGADADDGKFRRHFVDLGGLGVRDLHVDGKSLWILSGPTMVLDGPTRLLRWDGAFKAMEEGDTLTFKTAMGAEELDLSKNGGKDHPEGICLMPQTEGSARKMVVLYDGVAESHEEGITNAKADLLSLP